MRSVSFHLKSNTIRVRWCNALGGHCWNAKAIRVSNCNPFTTLLLMANTILPALFSVLKTKENAMHTVFLRLKVNEIRVVDRNAADSLEFNGNEIHNSNCNSLSIPLQCGRSSQFIVQWKSIVGM